MFHYEKLDLIVVSNNKSLSACHLFWYYFALTNPNHIILNADITRFVASILLAHRTVKKFTSFLCLPISLIVNMAYGSLILKGLVNKLMSRE